MGTPGDMAKTLLEKYKIYTVAIDNAAAEVTRLPASPQTSSRCRLSWTLSSQALKQIGRPKPADIYKSKIIKYPSLVKCRNASRYVSPTGSSNSPINTLILPDSGYGRPIADNVKTYGSRKNLSPGNLPPPTTPWRSSAPATACYCSAKKTSHNPHPDPLDPDNIGKKKHLHQAVIRVHK